MPRRRSSRLTGAPTAGTHAVPAWAQRRGRRRVLPVLAAALLAALAAGGCVQSGASYDVGLGTSRVSGVLEASPDADAAGGPLVVAYKYHHQFVNQADGSAVLRPTAHVLRPGREGSFAIAVPADVVRMEVFFIAPGHLTDVFRFRRQLGVGNIRYRPLLPPMDDWRSHFYTFLGPQLEHLVVEPRYRLPPADQRLLANWLQRQTARLGARRQTGAGPDGPEAAMPRDGSRAGNGGGS